MRIAGGQYGGLTLHAPKGRDVRPTSDKVRQAVFNILYSGGHIDGSFVLDAFCGTGALGIEALSRGADYAVFMDISRESLDFCRKNLSGIPDMEDYTSIIKSSACKPPPKPEKIPPANLVFLDPPYRKNLISPAIKALGKAGWLENTLTAVIEQATDEPAINLQGEIISTKEYGSTKIQIMSVSL